MKNAVIALALMIFPMITACQFMGEATFIGEGSRAPSLYEQLGKRPGIANIVEDLLYLIVEDERINQQFRGVDVRQLHTNLTDHLCKLSGGPCTYSGRGMREVHAAMNITDTQFNALAENLILSMEKNGVPVAAQNRLIKRLVPLYPAIRNL